MRNGNKNKEKKIKRISVVNFKCIERKRTTKNHMPIAIYVNSLRKIPNFYIIFFFLK